MEEKLFFFGFRFIIPDEDIHPGATRVNGFTKRNGQLYHNGSLVENAVSPRRGLTDFLTWIRSLDNVVLIAHNCSAFDKPVLLNNLEEYQVASRDLNYKLFLLN